MNSIADAVGILEQHRIIARRPGLLLRRMDDLDVVALREEGVDPVDRGAIAHPEAGVVQAGGALIEPLARIFGAAGANADRGAPADAIEHMLAVEHEPEVQIGDHRAPEGGRSCEIARGQDDMCDAVEVTRHYSPPAPNNAAIVPPFRAASASIRLRPS